MKFEIQDPIPFEPEEAFLLLRDEMAALVPFMEDTESINVVSREDSEGEARITNLWQASMNKIPSALRSFVKPEMLSWNDHAVWTSADHTGRWTLEALGSDKLFSCEGETAVIKEGGQTMLKITLNFEVYPEKVPGIPKLFAKKIGKQVEKLIGEILSTNMRQMAQSMASYAAQNRG
jgi:hypothetical protein